jgi:tight adherence protein B
MELFGSNLTGVAFAFVVAVAVGGLIVALLLPLFSSTRAESRTRAVAGGKEIGAKLNGLRARMAEESKDGRRRQIQDSLKQLEDKEKERKKKLTLRNQISQAGFDFTTRTFWFFSAISAVIFAVAPIFFGAPPYVGLGTAFVGLLGFPRWFLGYFRKRRQNKFINDFADAIDVMVRGLKAGLPVSEAMKIIASESGDPVGPEFMEVVEGQRVGIAIDQGIERMVERIPLSEVNFLAIVMAIQSKTGGNLSEALSNLSRVLRDRKKMKAKVQAVSQEAKSSAAIIGSLPFIMITAVWFLNPGYLDPLFTTQIGNILVFASAAWMTIGVLVMRKMINFEI